jgi:putative pyruvate formate lyase activating enzyme
MKYADESLARKYSRIPDYPAVNQAAVKEMHRQVGNLVLDEKGIAQRGLLIRHLLLPEDIAGTKEVIAFIADEISSSTYLNIMDQYRPDYNALDHPELLRRITREEYQRALDWACQAGLERLEP